MKALIEVVRSLIDGDDNSNDDDNGDGDDGTLRNLKEIDKDNLIEYLMRVLPFIIFFSIWNFSDNWMDCLLYLLLL